MGFALKKAQKRYMNKSRRKCLIPRQFLAGQIDEHSAKLTCDAPKFPAKQSLAESSDTSEA